jgi:outer membrane murein-binding lipoprotein Lpp
LKNNQGGNKVKQKMGLVICGVMVLLVGCASSQSPSSVNQLQIKVAQLERKLEDKESEVSFLKKRMEDLEDDFDAMGTFFREFLWKG